MTEQLMPKLYSDTDYESDALVPYGLDKDGRKTPP